MNHLLAFHIGPIQDFIATARRTQDLWMGSWLLSHLGRVAIENAQKLGAKLVLPKEIAKQEDANFDPAIADVPNHFTARYVGSEPEKMGSNVENAVRERWREIAVAVRKVFFDTPSHRVDDALWDREINNFLEIYWALVPDDGSTAARNHGQAALDARKRMRDFAPTEEKHLKCTLCGVRQELSGKTTNKDAGEWWVAVVAQHLKRGHLLKLRVRENGNERLCAVCAVKRAAVASQQALPQLQKTNGSFPSTSSVAAAMFKKHLLETGRAQREIKAHLKVLDDIGVPAKVEEDCVPKLARVTGSLPDDVRKKLLTFDGDLFYVETFTEKRLSEEYPEADATLAEFVVDSLRAVFRAVRSDDPAQHVQPPSKYFAALMMDGDHMGAYYGKMPEHEARAMSGQMSQFARKQAKEVVENYFGRLVYAGGDDVLALVPLDTALSCARDLQEKFKEAVEAALKGVVLPADVKRPTPSIGIAIAHHARSLDAVLTAMREAEKDAKNIYRRDALCVYVLKRSGEEVHVGTHWQAGEDGDKVDAVKVVTDLVDLLKDKSLSMKFPTVFVDEARFLPTGAIEAELRRVGERQRGEQFEQHPEGVQTWLTEAAKLAKAIGAEEFAQWTLLTRFIASGGRDEE